MKIAWLMIGIAVGLLGCGDSVTSGSGGSGGAGGDGSGGSGGAPGGCSTSNPCSDGVCIFPQGSCDPSATGVCQNGFTCDGPATGPICGCDGQVIEGEYAECTAWSNSMPYSDPDLCANAGVFACGMMLGCKRHVEVCVATTGGPAGSPTTYECVPISQIQGTCQHGIADCSCLDATSLGCPDASSCCTSDADHQETINIALP